VILKLNVDVDDERLLNILTQAVESACSYWAYFDHIVRDKDLNILSVKVHELEPSGDKRKARTVTPEDIGYAAERMSADKKVPRRHTDNFMSDSQWDDETADVLLQFVLFDEIVYG
jgi:hypothetical protein